MSLCGVEDDVGRRRAELMTHVEHPGRSDPVHPRAGLGERRLVDMAGKDDVRPVHADQAHEVGVAEIAAAAPADRRTVRRRVVHPDPAPRRRSASAASCPPIASAAIGPSHQGQMVKRVSSSMEAIAIRRRRARPARSGSSASPSLPPRPSELRSWLPEQTMSCVRSFRRAIYFWMTTLCVRRSTSEARSRWSPAMITTSKRRATSIDPVVLLQGVMQIGDDEASHCRVALQALPLYQENRLTSPSKNSCRPLFGCGSSFFSAT